MTRNKIITEISKVDGWKWHKGSELRFGPPIKGEKIIKRGWHLGKRVRETLPAYLTDRNAVVMVINKQDKMVQFAIDNLIHEKLYPKQPTICATERQLCEALLRVLGKWKE